MNSYSPVVKIIMKPYPFPKTLAFFFFYYYSATLGHPICDFQIIYVCIGRFGFALQSN